jgi:hypothetical protein
MREMALLQLLLIYMIIDINGFSSHIASKLLDELAGHACAPEVSREPMTAAMRTEVIFHLL